MKQPLKQMSLYTDEVLASLIDESNYAEHRELVAYIDNTNLVPENLPEDSEKARQFRYSGRKKIDKKTLADSITKNPA